MAYDEGVAQRVREQLAGRDGVEEKKMFGGLAFMVSGHMCCGVVDDRALAKEANARHAARVETRGPRTPGSETGRSTQGPGRGERGMTTEAPRLRRSHDQMIAGVCGGLAERYGWAPNRVRLGYVLLSILSAAFPGILVYLVLWFVMPGPEAGPDRNRAG